MFCTVCNRRHPDALYDAFYYDPRTHEYVHISLLAVSTTYDATQQVGIHSEKEREKEEKEEKDTI